MIVEFHMVPGGDIAESRKKLRDLGFEHSVDRLDLFVKSGSSGGAT